MASATATGPDPVEISDGVWRSTLPSGAVVLTESMPAVRSVSVGFWIGVGSRDEHAPAEGASHFLEHLLFKGTERRSAQEIAGALDAVGGDMNAFTGKEYTCFYARALDRDMPLAVDILGDMISSATILAEDVDAERDVVLEEIRMHLDTPDDLVHSVFTRALYPDHALGREILGSESSITGMVRDDVYGYYRTHYVPENLVVAVAGNVEHRDVLREVSRAVAGMPAAGAPTTARSTPLSARLPRAEVRGRPTEQAHVVLGRPGLRRSDPRRFAASVLNQALGGGMASRLFQEVRERRGLAYSVYSYHEPLVDTGEFAVYAGTAPSKVDDVLDVLRTELDRARRDGLSDEELARAKGNLAGSILMALESTGSRMSRLGKTAVTGTPLLSLDETLAAVEAVDAVAVHEIAEELLAGPFTLAAVGPLDGDVTAGYERYCAA